ncbi:MAG: ribonuclease J [Chloroflexi bacterium]|nr:ribonuclease J [Chloroflexota bacterium]
MSDERVRIIPLGGLGEVGKNMLLVEAGDDIVCIDAGMGFPEEEMLGIDLVIPDVSYLDDKRHRLRAIFLTHGHEDHIGGLPYVLPRLGFPPVYGTALTIGLVEVKLRERGLLEQADLRVIDADAVVQAGVFTASFFRVSHSIPDCVGVALDTPAGLIVQTGDFKFDQTPVDGRPTEFHKLAALGDRGVLAIISDCVHVETPGMTPSEKTVSDAFMRLFAEAPGRIIVATFASLISRIQQVIEVAEIYGRKVAVVGRSIEKNVEMAQQLGYLTAPDGVLRGAGELANLPDEQVVYVVTGAQGEPMAVLNRIANSDHRLISLRAGDTVIVSATPIPGNETSVGRIINSLFRQGARVIYSAIDRVHVSGHASQEELKLMLNLVRPRFVIPYHGEERHLHLYAELARSLGIPDEHILIGESGAVYELGPNSAEITGKVDCGYVFVDGLSVGEVGEVVIRDRQMLARDGILMVVVTIDRQTGELLAGPDIVTRGFVHSRESGELLDATKEQVRQALSANGHKSNDWSFLNRKIREVTGDYLYQQTKRRPMILPTVMEV